MWKALLDRWPRGMHAGTFRGNQIAMVAGKTAIEILQRDRLEGARRAGSLPVRRYSGRECWTTQASGSLNLSPRPD